MLSFFAAGGKKGTAAPAASSKTTVGVGPCLTQKISPDSALCKNFYWQDELGFELWTLANNNEAVKLRTLLASSTAHINWCNGASAIPLTLFKQVCFSNMLRRLCLQNKETALIQASYKGLIAVVQVLVEKGASLNLQEKVSGWRRCPVRVWVLFLVLCPLPGLPATRLPVRPIHPSAVFFCTYLQDGWTALHWAAVKGHAEIVELLIKKGADLTIKKKVSKHSGARQIRFCPSLDMF
jgi:hypothetical protein